MSLLAEEVTKPRVFVTDSQSWEVSGGFGGSSSGFGGAMAGGAHPQTAEIIKTFGEKCPDAIINNKQDKADYVVLLDHEGGKGYARKDNKVVVFNKDGDSIVSHSTRSLGNAVKDGCDAILHDWPTRDGKATTVEPLAANPEIKAGANNATSQISVSSTPSSADIEVDGGFVGNTPSVLGLNPGDHSITIKKVGYKTWERKVKVMGGSINISAELEKTQN